MNREISVPKIRFYEFSRNWENFKLGSCSEIKAGGTPKTGNPDYWFPKEIPWMSSGEVNKKRLYDTNDKISKNGLDNSSARWIKEKSILIALAGQGKTRGTVAITEIPITTNQSIAAIEVDDTLDSEFVFQNLESRYDELRRISSGDGSRGGLNKQIISEINIIGPQVSEQIKVGKLFKRIDYTIKLQQQLLDDHKQLKKAMLQKMFPQKGENTPRVRFNQFNYEWEEKKLSNLFEIRNIKQVPTIEAPLMAFTSTGGVESKGERFNREFLVKNKNKTYKRTELNDLIYSSNNLDVGAIARNKYGAAVISDVYEIFKTQDTVTPLFSEIFIKNKGFLNKVLKYRQGALYGQYRIYASDFLSVDTLIPSIKEQEKIGDFFEQLDETITLHEKKLETYQELKKAMLQKMFV